jgi:hypothetical protein
MWEQLEAQFTKIMKPLFPNEAKFNRITSDDDLNIDPDDLCFSVAWKFNDPDHTKMFFRRIVLVVTQEKLQDYGSDDHISVALEIDITKSVVERLKTFKSNHDNPSESIPFFVEI